MYSTASIVIYAFWRLHGTKEETPGNQELLLLEERLLQDIWLLKELLNWLMQLLTELIMILQLMNS
jgi:hypothetical protein